VDADERVLVRETPEATPAEPAAPAAPAAEAPPAETPAETPAEPQTPAPVAPPEQGTMLQLQQELVQLREAIAELRQPAAPSTNPATPPADPAAAAAKAAELQAQADELDRMLAPDYEVDLAQDAKTIAKAVKSLQQSLAQEVKRLREETTLDRSAREENERRQAFQQLDSQVKARDPKADLKSLYNQAAQQARQEGYADLGPKAFEHRTGQLLQARIDALAPAAPPAAPAAPAAVPKPATPTPQAPKPPVAPITPNGANARIPAVGGNPRVTNPVLTEDEIYEKHSNLVR
jgi:hypothetical protein